MRQTPQFRAKSASAGQPRTARAVSTAGAPASVSFAKDIMPLFKQFQGPMMWRLDLTSYDAVKANADTIYTQISTQSMPPPPFQPLKDEQIALFKVWMDSGFPP
ncbi:MAG TPA: hypothetical protein VH394_21015 [Thermoanaerobaculia bacterium]|jgi:hypothetical protein|nr:hypothetical protein [Thermoanaerobaculia bacterium]